MGAAQQSYDELGGFWRICDELCAFLWIPLRQPPTAPALSPQDLPHDRQQLGSNVDDICGQQGSYGLKKWVGLTQRSIGRLRANRSDVKPRISYLAEFYVK